MYVMFETTQRDMLKKKFSVAPSEVTGKSTYRIGDKIYSFDRMGLVFRENKPGRLAAIYKEIKRDIK